MKKNMIHLGLVLAMSGLAPAQVYTPPAPTKSNGVPTL